MMLGTPTATTAAAAAITIVAARPTSRAEASGNRRTGRTMSWVNATAPALSSESRLDMMTETVTTRSRI